MSVVRKSSLDGGDYSGGGYDESDWDLDYGGVTLDDPTSGDLGTIPDPMTTLPVDVGFDPASGELSGDIIPGYDFGATPGFDSTLPTDTVGAVPDPGMGQDDPGGELTAGSGGTDPSSDNSGFTDVLGEAGSILGGLLGGFGDLLNGANKGVGSPTKGQTQNGSPSSPGNNNPTTTPVGFIDVHAENTTTFLVLAFGLVAFFLIRK